VLLFGVARPTLRNITTPRLQVLEGGVAALTGTTAQDDAPAAATGQANNYEDKLRLAKATVAQDPKKVAQIVKNWVNDDA